MMAIASHGNVEPPLNLLVWILIRLTDMPLWLSTHVIRGEGALRGMPASVRASYECVAIREFRVGFGDLGFGSL